MKRFFHFFAFLSFSAFSPLAKAEEPDTLLNYSLDEVCIVQPRTVYYSDSYKVKTFGKGDLATFASKDAGQLLSSVSSVFIKSYGAPGNLASVSFRGTLANHTQVTWNGFPINSPTTGDADLSLIPAIMADKISLVYGASGSLYGGGTFGGSVDLTTSSTADRGFRTGISTEAGSYGSWFTAGNIAYTGKRMAVKSVVFSRNAENRYPYKDIYRYGAPMLMQTHNQLRSYGMFHFVSFSLSPVQQVQAGLWYQDKFKNLPALMGSYVPSVATQKDSTLKLFIRYVRSMPRASLVIKNAFFNDNLFYKDPSSSINSTISTKQYFGDVNFRKLAGKRITWDAGGTIQYILAQVANYGKPVDETRFAVFTAGRFQLNTLVFHSAFRIDVYPETHPVPLPSAGFKKTFRNDRMYIRASVAAKYRPPTFNEKYWQPGGNPGLHPEKGYTVEAGSGILFSATQKYSVTIDLTAFSTKINDLILWTGEGMYYEPVNFRKVWARGTELSLNHSWWTGNWKIQQQGEISYIRSTSTEVYDNSSAIQGKQLRYVPVLSGFYSGTFNYTNYSFRVSLNYIGKRYITDDHSGNPLSPYVLTNLSFAWRFHVLGFTGDLYVRADNLFNTSYQVIKGFPMPGRFLALGFRVEFQR